MQSLSDRLPPQHLEAERGCIGSVMLDNGLIDAIVEEVNLRPDDFYRDAHGQAWSHVLALFNQGQPVDAVSMAESMERAGVFTTVGGDEFLESLVNSVPHAANGKYYAHVVKQKAISRKLIEVSTQIVNSGYSNQFTAEELLALAEREILAIGEKDAGSRSMDTNALMDATIGDLTRRQRGQVVGISTGFADLDDVLGGLQGGQLVVVAARPSIGKTALALNVAARVAEMGWRVLLVSLEMGARELGDRLLSLYSGVSSHVIKLPRLLDPPGYAAIMKADSRIRELPIVIDDKSGRTVGSIAALARRTKSRGGLDLLVVDQLSLVNGEHVKGENREQVVARISRGFKALAQELGVPLIMAHQLNRGVEARADKRPMLADLRESGAVEADSDIALLLHRPEFYDPNDRPGECDLYVSKNRNGRTGVVPLVFRKDLMRFDSWAGPNGEASPY